MDMKEDTIIRMEIEIRAMQSFAGQLEEEKKKQDSEEMS